jgi:hypothetical protein
MSPQIDPPSPDLILTPREWILANIIDLLEQWQDEDDAGASGEEQYERKLL